MSDDFRAIASEFWAHSGVGGDPPRDLESAVLWSLPVYVVKIPRLATEGVRAWLEERGLVNLAPPGARRLRACIVSARGVGFTFIDGADSEAEQRYSLAHEVAHFLLDYFLPRRRAIDVLGDGILDVLNGERSPSDQERFSAVLRGVKLGVYSRLWDRGPDGLARDLEAVGREDAADALALELLAPRGEATKAARELGWDPDAVAEALTRRFLLPTDIASAYAKTLCIAFRPSTSFREWLGVKER